MKATIHPKWYADAQVTCACGNTFTVGSTRQKIDVEICAKCHPFFTGEIRFLDTLGRVEKFQQRVKAQAVTGKPVSKKQKQVLKKKQEDEEEANRPKSLKEMLDRVRTTN